MSLDFNARIDYKYQGGDTKFSVPFSYINKSHIYVIINGDIDNPTQEFTWLSENQISLAFRPNIDDIVSIRRVTPNNEKMVVFEDNNILDEETQNLAQDQVFNVMQEVKDNNNWLISEMQTYIDLKNTIENALNTIDESFRAAQTAANLLSQTETLVNNISNSYNEMQEQIEAGLPCSVSYNLFDLRFTDKELTASESIGFKAQGSSVNQSEYPDAYTEILNEYETGTNQVFTSSDELVYYKSYTGSTTGNFYIPYTATLAEGVDVYSDTTCSTVLGEVTEYGNIEADSYSLDTTDTFYIAKDSTIETNKTVYSDNLLSTTKGIITGVKNVQVQKYTGSKSGSFYTSYDLNLRVGRVVYEDVALENELGTITQYGEINSDKYYVSGLENTDCFYVPDGTLISNGITVYSDPACTASMGTITTKGTVTTQGVNRYSYSSAIFIIGGGMYTVAAGSIYTKGSVQVGSAIYETSSCTSPNGTVGTWNGSQMQINNFYLAGRGTGTLLLSGVQLASSSTASSYNYITIGNSATKLQYYKQADTTGTVIVIDEGTTETFTEDDIIAGTFLKLDTGNYKSYTKTGTVSNMSISIDNENLETVTDNGFGTAQGVVFEYVLASNGHKIVNSKYQNTIESMLEDSGQSEYYLIDTSTKKFTLPTLNETKYIYFCVGNTVLKEAGINGVTQESLNNKLEEYVKYDSDLMDTITTMITDFYEMTGEVQSILNEIVGE